MDGKVAFITGAARGQGRSDAVRLAEEGADITAVDICRSLPTVPYGGATAEDLRVRPSWSRIDRRIVVREADVCDLGQLEAAVQEGLSELGHIDVVCCNAGIASYAPTLEWDEQMWQVNDRHQPDGGLEDHPRCGASDGGTRPGGIGHHHQLGLRPLRVSQRGQLRKRQARSGGTHADADRGISSAQDPG